MVSLQRVGALQDSLQLDASGRREDPKAVPATAAGEVATCPRGLRALTFIHPALHPCLP